MTRRLCDDDGANAVEFALILPILVVLIFGGIYAGLALNHDLSLSTAAREGARFAATYEPNAFVSGVPEAAWFTDVLDRVEAESNGSLGPGAPGGRICVAFVQSGGAQTTRQREWPGGTESDTSPPSCNVSDGLSSQERVHVAVRRDAPIQAVLLRIPVTVHSEAVARYEREDP